MLPRAVPLHPRFVTLITSAVAAVTGVGLGNARGSARLGRQEDAGHVLGKPIA